MSNVTYPTQFKIKNISIDGVDIMGLFLSLEIFENIFIPAVSGSLQFLDTDGGGFVDENKIEFNEDFDFSITNAADETMTFKGVLNGLASERSNKNQKIYTVDFITKEMRENDMLFVSEKIKETPQNVIKDMIQRCQGKLNSSGADGKEMEFVAGRWKPLRVITHVLTHGVSDRAQATNNGDQVTESSKGTTGFLCWQTIGQKTNDYRFCTVDELLKGAFDTHEPYRMMMNMGGEGIEHAMQSIVEYNFKDMGDIQTKMKSGAFRSINISFDLDTGLYKEYEYDASQEKGLMTEKQKKIVQKPTRVCFKPYTNDRFTKDCKAAPDNTGDQSREYLQQNNTRQNTFNDQTGVVTFYPQFKVHAGDIIELKINKIESGNNKGTTENQKHSGKYVVKQVGHHFTSDGRAFTKVTTIRSTTQQDLQTARK